MDIRVPDIGDFSDVPVIEVLVKAGEAVTAEQSLVTLESDKATMEIPAPAAGTIASVEIAIGDTVSEGTLIAVLETGEPAGPETGVPAEDTVPPLAAAGGAGFDFDLVVLGSGPGGYTAAFRAADLGLKVALVERFPDLGGVCLHVGCIPSKALLHTAGVIEEAAQLSARGVTFGEPEIDLDTLRTWKDAVVGQLSNGLSRRARRRRVTVIRGTGRFTSPHELHVGGGAGDRQLSFAQAIIAVGSRPCELPGLPRGDRRIMDSTRALRLDAVPRRLLVVGGGIIGLELAGVYQSLGSRVVVVELTGQLLPGADADLVQVLHDRIAGRCEGVYLETGLATVIPGRASLRVELKGTRAPGPMEFDRILVAVGRVPNGGGIGAEEAGIEVSPRGFIPVDEQMRTRVPHIFAIGDVVGQPMLAHKATHEGRVAAEVCAGEKSAFDARAIPYVAYTDPEIAWVGMTEGQARESGIAFGLGKFPWAASGRALGMGRPEGLTKLLFDQGTGRVIGAGMVGPHAGDLVAECALAIEMGAEAADIGLTIHPHPTLSESIAMAAEAYEGTITDLYIPKRG